MSSAVGDRIRELIYRQTEREWLVNFNSCQFLSLFDQYDRKFNSPSQQDPRPHILLAHSEPWHYLAALLAAIARDCPVFLGNPQWQAREWQQVGNLLTPGLIVGDGVLPCNENLLHPPSLSLPPHSVMIATGGTSGHIRFAIHTWQTLNASIQGFCKYFAIERVNSCCVLPIYHVGGLMPFLRSFLAQGQFWLGSYKEMSALPSPLTNWFVSLVPTQLYTLIKEQNNLLSQFGCILLGGAPAWGHLLETARSHRLPLAPTYGMTETASQVVTLKSSVFLAGNSSSGRKLPHAWLSIQDGRGQSLPPNTVGRVVIRAKSQFLGYYPDFTDNPPPLITDDLGYIDESGYLYVLGRNSQKIVTGGENVYPLEVESALRATNLLQDVAVVGIADRLWGQVIAAVYVPVGAHVTSSLLKDALSNQLARFKIPKYWLEVDALPRNAQGKVIYQQLQSAVRDSCKINFQPRVDA